MQQSFRSLGAWVLALGMLGWGAELNAASRGAPVAIASAVGRPVPNAPGDGTANWWEMYVAAGKLSEFAGSVITAKNIGGMQVTSSDPARVIGVASSEAQSGVVVVSVDNLALPQTNYSNLVANPDSAEDFQTVFNLGTLKIQAHNADPHTFVMDEHTTLNALADAIGRCDACPVIASTVQTPGGVSLLLVGKQTGTDARVGYEEHGTSLGLASNIAQSGVDAMYALNGKTLSSPTNTVIDVLPGLTVHFIGAGAPEILIIGFDGNHIARRVREFVDALDRVIVSAIYVARGRYDAAAAAKLVANLSAAAAGPAPAATGTYTALTDIGISVAEDGTLDVDGPALEYACGVDAASVVSLLVTSPGGVKGVGQRVKDVVEAWLDQYDI